MYVLDLQPIIDEAFENLANINSKTVSKEVKYAIEQVIDALDSGVIRVAEKKDGDWVTNQWIKKAVLLSFRIQDNFLTEVPGGAFYDKVPLKFDGYSAEKFAQAGIHACPGCVVRRGAYLEPNTICLPSFVNIGAHVGSGTMVGTWATVGSCAQVGKNVHIAGGAGNLSSKDGKYSLYTAIIVKRVDEKTCSKVGLNELLRVAQEEAHINA